MSLSTKHPHNLLKPAAPNLPGLKKVLRDLLGVGHAGRNIEALPLQVAAGVGLDISYLLPHIRGLLLFA
jgi:hypothetical protein